MIQIQQQFQHFEEGTPSLQTHQEYGAQIYQSLSTNYLYLKTRSLIFIYEDTQEYDKQFKEINLIQDKLQLGNYFWYKINKNSQNIKSLLNCPFFVQAENVVEGFKKACDILSLYYQKGQNLQMPDQIQINFNDYHGMNESHHIEGRKAAFIIIIELIKNSNNIQSFQNFLEFCKSVLKYKNNLYNLNQPEQNYDLYIQDNLLEEENNQDHNNYHQINQEDHKNLDTRQ